MSLKLYPPPASATAQGAVTTGTQTFAGAKTFSSAITASGGIAGSDGTGDATAGNVGEYKEELQDTAANYAGTGVWADMKSFELTPGDWDVSLITVASRNGATVTNIECGISSTPGNFTTGLTYGVNRAANAGPTATNNSTVSVPSFRVKVTSNTIYYAKISADFTVATPQVRGRLSARRVR